MADTEKRITAKMILDSSGFNNSIKGVNNELKNAQSELRLASSGIQAFGKNTEGLSKVQESLTKQLDLHNKKVEFYNNSMEKTSKTMQENIKKKDELIKSIDSANSKYDEAIKLYGKESEQAKKAKDEVDKLTEEYKKKEIAIESNAKRIKSYENELNRANTEINKTQGELNKVTKELQEQDNKWKNASKTLDEHSEKLKNYGSKVSGVGDNILKFTAPIAAAGIASAKFSMDFEDSMAKVSTISDDSQVPLSDLGKAIINLSNDSGVASTEIANNVYDAISAGQSTGDAVNFVTNSTKLAKAGFAEAGQSLDLLTTILNAYELEASQVTKVSDILINTQDKGKVTVGELSASMGKVIPTAKAFGVNLEQVATGYAIMTAKGIKSAETTTYMNSMFNELGKSGTKASDTIKEVAGKSFQELIKEGKSVGDILALIKEHADKNNLSLADMFGSAEAGKAALILSNNAGQDFNNMLKDMNDTAGSTDSAFNKVASTGNNKLKKTLNELKNESIRFGDAIAPVLDKAVDLIGKITDKISNLSDEQLESIAKWGMISVASGGALKVIGGGISTVGNIAGGISKLTGALGKASVATEVVGTTAKVAGGVGGLGSLVTGLGAAASAALPFVAGAAVVGVAGYGIYKTMTKEVVPSVDLFADKLEVTGYKMTEYGQVAETTSIKISDETKKQVQAYLELDEGAQSALNDLYTNSTIITEQTCTGLISKYQEMGNTITSGLQEDKNNDINLLNDFFSKSSAISEEEEQFIVSNTDQMYQSKTDIINQKNSRIKEILENAKNQNRQLSIDEKNEISQIQQEMKNQAIQTLSANEVEAQVILQRMKDYDGRITAEQAAEHIQKLNSSRDQAVQTANDEYEKRIAAITKLKNESGVLSEEQANKLIEEAKKQRDGVVEKAEETRVNAIDKMRALNKDLDEQVNTQKGTVLTTWDKVKRWWSDWKPESKSFNASVNTSYTERMSGNTIGANWTGTNYWQGGLTYMHEKGYELYELPKTSESVYNLPRGSKVYNHEASEAMIMKTAESVAEKVAKGITQGHSGNGGISVTQNIYAPTPSPSEISRQTKNNLKELVLNL